MKMRIFPLDNDVGKGRALAYLAEMIADGSTEACFRNASESKTLRQLGAIFGVWEMELSTRHSSSGEKVHAWLKAAFLARIYWSEPKNKEQAQWVELCAMYQQAGEIAKLEKHAKRISLKWATLDQTKQFMNDIEAHYQDIGEPVTALDPRWSQK